jgi:hypothetical protein
MRSFMFWCFGLTTFSVAYGQLLTSSYWQKREAASNGIVNISPLSRADQAKIIALLLTSSDWQEREAAFNGIVNISPLSRADQAKIVALLRRENQVVVNTLVECVTRTEHYREFCEPA